MESIAVYRTRRARLCTCATPQRDAHPVREMVTRSAARWPPRPARGRKARRRR